VVCVVRLVFSVLMYSRACLFHACHLGLAVCSVGRVRMLTGGVWLSREKVRSIRSLHDVSSVLVWWCCLCIRCRACISWRSFRLVSSLNGFLPDGGLTVPRRMIAVACRSCKILARIGPSRSCWSLVLLVLSITSVHACLYCAAIGCVSCVKLVFCCFVTKGLSRGAWVLGGSRTMVVGRLSWSGQRVRRMGRWSLGVGKEESTSELWNREGVMNASVRNVSMCE
jgi:hypothetical protein